MTESADIAALAAVLERRIVIYRDIVDLGPDGKWKVVARIYRGWFVGAPHGATREGEKTDT